jgi:LmbE family N-acetylglucosaminyl deacetylase
VNEIILIVAAHPDDEVLGVGGTIARLSQEGHKVYIAVMGGNVRYQRQDCAGNNPMEILHRQSRAVAQHLSAQDVFFGNLPGNRFDTVPLLDIVERIERLVAELHPVIIYTHYGGDLNIDHQIILRAVLTATRPLNDCPVREIYTFETPSSTEWAFGEIEPVFHPNVFMDIAETLEMKVKAMQLYESEARPFPHPRSREVLYAIARRWGSMVGLEAAEAFQLVRATR